MIRFTRTGVLPSELTRLKQFLEGTENPEIHLEIEERSEPPTADLKIFGNNPEANSSSLTFPIPFQVE